LSLILISQSSNLPQLAMLSTALEGSFALQDSSTADAEKVDGETYPTLPQTPKAEADPSLQDSSSENSSHGIKGVEEPPRPVKGMLWLLVVISILSSTFPFSLDNTIVVSKKILPNLRRGDCS
jgi:hypothetical protein